MDPPKKKDRPSLDGPSLGRKRPRRAAASPSTLGDAALQNKACNAQKLNCKICRAARKSWNGADWAKLPREHHGVKIGRSIERTAQV